MFSIFFKQRKFRKLLKIDQWRRKRAPYFSAENSNHCQSLPIRNNIHCFDLVFKIHFVTRFKSNDNYFQIPHRLSTILWSIAKAMLYSTYLHISIKWPGVGKTHSHSYLIVLLAVGTRNNNFLIKIECVWQLLCESARRRWITLEIGWWMYEWTKRWTVQLLCGSEFVTMKHLSNVQYFWNIWHHVMDDVLNLALLI